MVWQKNIVLRAIMEKERSYASIQALESHLRTLDLKRLYKNLEDYVYFRLKKKDRDTASDIVDQAFEKLFSQDRKWYDDQSFEEMIFGAVKSLSHNENKKQVQKWEREASELDIESLEDSSLNPEQEFEHKELVKIALELLKTHEPSPTDLEIEIFECWIEDLNKQQDIAMYLEKDIKEIRKGVKRLKGKLISVQDRFLKMGYEKK